MKAAQNCQYIKNHCSIVHFGDLHMNFISMQLLFKKRAMWGQIATRWMLILVSMFKLVTLKFQTLKQACLKVLKCFLHKYDFVSFFNPTFLVINKNQKFLKQLRNSSRVLLKIKSHLIQKESHLIVKVLCLNASELRFELRPMRWILSCLSPLKLSSWWSWTRWKGHKLFVFVVFLLLNVFFYKISP